MTHATELHLRHPMIDAGLGSISENTLGHLLRSAKGAAPTSKVLVCDLGVGLAHFVVNLVTGVDLFARRARQYLLKQFMVPHGMGLGRVLGLGFCFGDEGLHQHRLILGHRVAASLIHIFGVLAPLLLH